ncbi:unnamed protein product [Bursaphelenchus okinawaensis]|uniref:Histone-lysine N-methyltransferase n=1 Tax=Bursaphelenchus okinawaensis TaxID=465554 RepID=A0A811JQU8_9BILA|nr:unnamed protein product [Bursaphelenchus okinawaensis]CAG9078593.1 unnamed protein product [Bursaphelenchus okinawaensis]
MSFEAVPCMFKSRDEQDRETPRYGFLIRPAGSTSTATSTTSTTKVLPKKPLVQPQIVPVPLPATAIPSTMKLTSVGPVPASAVQPMPILNSPPKTLQLKPAFKALVPSGANKQLLAVSGSIPLGSAIQMTSKSVVMSSSVAMPKGKKAAKSGTQKCAISEPSTSSEQPAPTTSTSCRMSDLQEDLNSIEMNQLMPTNGGINTEEYLGGQVPISQQPYYGNGYDGYYCNQTAGTSQMQPHSSTSMNPQHQIPYTYECNVYPSTSYQNTQYYSQWQGPVHQPVHQHQRVHQIQQQVSTSPDSGIQSIDGSPPAMAFTPPLSSDAFTAHAMPFDPAEPTPALQPPSASSAASFKASTVPCQSEEADLSDMPTLIRADVEASPESDEGPKAGLSTESDAPNLDSSPVSNRSRSVSVRPSSAMNEDVFQFLATMGPNEIINKLKDHWDPEKIQEFEKSFMKITKPEDRPLSTIKDATNSSQCHHDPLPVKPLLSLHDGYKENNENAMELPTNRRNLKEYRRNLIQKLNQRMKRMVEEVTMRFSKCKLKIRPDYRLAPAFCALNWRKIEENAKKSRRKLRNSEKSTVQKTKKFEELQKRRHTYSESSKSAFKSLKRKEDQEKMKKIAKKSTENTKKSTESAKKFAENAKKSSETPKRSSETDKKSSESTKKHNDSTKKPVEIVKKEERRGRKRKHPLPDSESAKKSASKPAKTMDNMLDVVPMVRKRKRSKNMKDEYIKIRSNVLLDQPPRLPEPEACECEPEEACLTKNCPHRAKNTECTQSTCSIHYECRNRRMLSNEAVHQLQMFDTKDRGRGIKTTVDIQAGQFVCEYVGEVMKLESYQLRHMMRSVEQPRFGVQLTPNYVVDATNKGNIARFMNHSCKPNCEMQRWQVGNQYRLGIFAKHHIPEGQELTYDYKYHARMEPAQECKCNEPRCASTIPSQAPPRPVLEPEKLTKQEKISVKENRLFLLRNLRKSTKKSINLKLNLDKIFERLEENVKNGQNVEKPEQSLDEVLKNSTKIDKNNEKTAKNAGKSTKNEEKSPQDQMPEEETPYDLIEFLTTLYDDLIQHADKVKKTKLAQLKSQILKVFRLKTSEIQLLQAFDNTIKFWMNSLQTSCEKRQIESLRSHYTHIKKNKDVLKFMQDQKALNTKEAVKSFTEDRKRTSLNGTTAKRTDTRVLSADADLTYMDKDLEPVGSYNNDNMVCIEENTDSSDCVRCVCGMFEDDGKMVECDTCKFWLHADCVKYDSKSDDYECDFCLKSIKSPPKADIVLNPQPDETLPNCTYYRTLVTSRGLQVRINEAVYVEKTINEDYKVILKQLLDQTPKKKAKKGDVKEGKKSEVKDNKKIKKEKQEWKRSDLRCFRIERLFTGPNGERFVFGCYYARPHETFCDSNRLFHKKELFWTPLFNTLPLDAVVGRCLVLEPNSWCEGRPKEPFYKEDDVYVCEYQIDKSQRTFTKMPANTHYTPNKESYVFNKFTEPLKIKRDFTPFVLTMGEKKPDRHETRDKCVSSAKELNMENLKAVIANIEKHQLSHKPRSK